MEPVPKNSIVQIMHIAFFSNHQVFLDSWEEHKGIMTTSTRKKCVLIAFWTSIFEFSRSRKLKKHLVFCSLIRIFATWQDQRIERWDQRSERWDQKTATKSSRSGLAGGAVYQRSLRLRFLTSFLRHQRSVQNQNMMSKETLLRRITSLENLVMYYKKERFSGNNDIAANEPLEWNGTITFMRGATLIFIIYTY